MPSQRQIRGAAATTQNARTLVSRELDIDITNWRLKIHTGSEVGGVPLPNADDIIDQHYSYAAATGTNALTATYAKDSGTPSDGQRLSFKAESTNTGSVTFNPNSNGAVEIKKKDVATGDIVSLGAGDIIQNGNYDVTYNSTEACWVVDAVDGGGLQAVSQGDLNTSTGTFSLLPSGGDIDLNGTAENIEVDILNTVTMPGGQYGFCVLSRRGSGAGATGGWWFNGTSTSAYTSTLSPISGFSGGGNAVQALGQQRYITSSPPFDLGDGEAGGFIFLKLNKNGEVLGSYAADVPPWGYNGPTDIRATAQCKITGKKYKRQLMQRSFEEIMDGAALEYELVEICQKVKNADMGLIPHPFGEASDRIVLLDPMDDRAGRLIEMLNSGGADDVQDALDRGLIYTEDRKLKRKGPKGVKITPLLIK